MDSSYISPFVFSVTNVFETMLQMPVEVKSPALKQQGAPSFDVSGIIGMSGDVDGTVVLSFPTAVAERVVALFTGMELSAAEEDFADAVGELVNMVSGGAKAKFEGKDVTITTPSVVIGQDHTVFGRKDVTCVEIPCVCDAGEFNVEVSIKQSAAAASAASAGSAAV
ncbi:MAG: chemotaxis protein CheX [Planctomycetota bacterium]